MSATDQKLIFVIGGTGAQGIAVIDALLAPGADGAPSPYAIRALTRDPESRRAKELKAKGVELVKGQVEDLQTVFAALQGAWGAFVNTDGFTMGEQKEVFYGMRIFELAKQAKTVRHYIWGNLDYITKKANYDPKYKTEHYDGKGRVADWLKAQPSVVSDDELSWSVLTSGPYMDMLKFVLLGPITRRKDGTLVWAFPTDMGHIPMVALEDIGFIARYSFDNRAEVSGKDLEVASEMATLDSVVATFTRVTGRPAVAVHLTIEEWFRYWKNTDRPVANERPVGDGSTTWKQNFTAFFSMWRDDRITRDMEWNHRVNPNLLTLERWMRKENYTGEVELNLLKNAEDGKSAYPDFELVAAELGQ
ncbi:NmrA/HSCARG family protein [Phanerochaete sordida]|uniref:NmrA/HSCARG family protein n=1 Tax=Phanerochaete sordida TaxID=48140 RepID=A0A9P3GBY3_9APHY|nr:NmrA/HSCARG family protein [Phanerochaete sordida]